MRRLLCCVVAAGLVIGGLFAAGMSREAAAQRRSLGAGPTASLLGPGAAGSEAFVDDTARPGAQSHQKRSSKAAGSSVRKQISFKAPIGFATGAGPSSAAFNLAHGGQGPGLYFPSARSAPLITSVAVGDFNRDGKPDLAQTNVVVGTVSVLIGDGRGGFSPPQQVPVGMQPVFVVAGDLDGDGILDLIVANYVSHNVSVLRGDGRGGFVPTSLIPVPGPRNIAIGNFNGDKLPDLAVASVGRSIGANASPVGGIAILTGTEGGGFNPAQFIRPTLRGRPVGVNYVAAGDFDGSGFDDLAAGVGTSLSAGDRVAGDPQVTGDDVLIFVNRDRRFGATPEQPFTTSEQQRARVGATPNAIAVADLNGDIHLDLAVSGLSGDITTLLGDGGGHFVVQTTNTTAGSLPFSLATGDFNDDRVVDLVTGNWISSTVSVLQGNGNGTFQPAVDFWSGDATTSAAVGDLNGDGRIDVVAGRFRDDHLALLLNDSPKPGDGVVVTRDIPYPSPTHPTDDPFAAHHTLDVYMPPKGTVSFAGRGRPYPVVFFAHGGSGMAGDKTMVSYLMRSLAGEGLVGVSIDYRLGGPPAPKADQIQDVVAAFRWTRDNIGSIEYGGDPRNIYVSGTSTGAERMVSLATDAPFVDEQRDIRGLVTLAGHFAQPGDTPRLPPSLLLTSDGSGDQETLVHTAAFAARSRQRGQPESTQVIVRDRDHLTVVARSALPGDRARVEMFKFLRSHLVAQPPAGAPGTRCRPDATLARKGLRLTRWSVRLVGASVCGALVEVALARVQAGRCRFLGRGSRLGGRRGCGRPVWLLARGAKRWTFTRRARLPRGSYTAWVRSGGARPRQYRLDLRRGRVRPVQAVR